MAITPKNDRYAVVVVAAGSGCRYGADIPKQFLELAGKPVLRHCLDTFRTVMPEAPMVLVLSEVGRRIWTDYCAAVSYTGPAVAPGGASRSDSVLNGLLELRRAGVPDDAIVFIHDGARPLVSERVLADIAEAFAQGCEAAAPAVKLTDSIAAVTDGFATASVDRDSLRALQTPQTFRLGVIIDVLSRLVDEHFSATDECGAFMRLTGGKTKLIEGDRTNIKITNPGDLALAELFLRKIKC